MFDNEGDLVDAWFFEELFTFIRSGEECIEVRTIDGSGSVGAISTFDASRPGQIAAWIDDPEQVREEVGRQAEAGKGLGQTFFGVAPRSANPRERGLVTSVVAVHAHVPADQRMTVKKAVVMLRSANPTPTAILASQLSVDSYWFFNRRLDGASVQQVGRLNRFVAEQCGVSRHFSGPGRLLQAPGGIQSSKTTSGWAGFMLPWFDPERRYSLQDLADIRILGAGAPVEFDDNTIEFIDVLLGRVEAPKAR